jgi:3-(3-hydroxy-phenyl)propionate hydroxylase
VRGGADAGPGATGPSETSRRLEAALARDIDVLVVGYGPTGAACANFLGRYGVRTMVIDRFAEVLMQPRAIALDHDALRILQNSGLAEGDLDTVAIPRVEMRSPVWGVFNRIDTSGPKNGHPRLVTFYQPDLERTLRARVAERASVFPVLGVELTGLRQMRDWVVAELNAPDGPREVRCRYLVGADGANSIVRKLVGLEFGGKSFQEDWLVVDAAGSPTKIDHVEFLCDPRRPTPHMVGPAGRERWEFMLRPGEAEELQREPERIEALLSRWRRPGSPLQVERKAFYRFQARTARRFDQGRVFLAGDAAHVTPPFIGQGLVAGLRDAANLAWKLAWVVRRHADPSILKSYTTERRPHAAAMIRRARMMGGLVTPRSWLQAFLLHGAVRLLLGLRGGRRGLDVDLVKPPNRFPRGLFAARSRASGDLTGDLLPQTWLRNDRGETRLSDEVLGANLCVLGFGVDPAACLATEQASLRAMDAQLLQIRHRGQALHLARGTPSWEDLSGGLLPGAAPFGWILVVRPDRTILQAGPAGDAVRIIRDAAAILRSPVVAAARARAEAAVPQEA